MTQQPATQPATMDRASIQALILRNCSATPCQKVTFSRAASACAKVPAPHKRRASHSK